MYHFVLKTFPVSIFNIVKKKINDIIQINGSIWGSLIFLNGQRSPEIRKFQKCDSSNLCLPREGGKKRPMVGTHSRNTSGRIIRSFPVLKSKHSIKLAIPSKQAHEPVSFSITSLQLLHAILFLHPYLNFVLWPTWFTSHLLNNLPFPPLGLCSCCSTEQKIILAPSWLSDILNLFFNTQFKFHFLCEVFFNLKLHNPVCSFLQHFLCSPP